MSIRVPIAFATSLFGFLFASAPAFGQGKAFQQRA
jgi:hypothetical protein